METLRKDLGFALRLLARRPGFTAVIVLSLALAIGANTAIFSIVNTIALGEVDIPEPDRVVGIYTTDEKNPGHLPSSDQNIIDLREASSEMMDVAFYTLTPMTLRDEAAGSSETVAGMVVSGNYFGVLGLGADLGRLLDHPDHELGAHLEVVIAHHLWQERFGGDEGIVGRSIVLGSQSVTVVGVTPEGFGGTNLHQTDVFVPYSAHHELMPHAPFFDERRFLAFFPVARLHEGVSSEQARQEVDRIGQVLAAEYPVVNVGRSFTTVPLSHTLVGPDQRNVVLAASTLLMTIIGFVLLIACANAANLMLARAASRRAEIAVRCVLGATRGRIVRQMLTESMLLATAAAGFGLLLALPLRNFVWDLRPTQFGGIAVEPELDGTVLLFLVGITLGTGLLCGLAPALRAASTDLMTPLKEETTPLAPTSRRLSLRSGLVVFQVALSTVALVGAGLFFRSMGNAQAVDLGFETEALVLADIDMRSAQGDPAMLAAQRTTVIDALEALPEVQQASMVTRPPLNPGGLMLTLQIDEREADAEDGMLFPAIFSSPGAFEALGQPLLEGRDFSDDDSDIDVEEPGAVTNADDNKGVVIVNETFARRYWPDGEALGKRVTLTFTGISLEIVGVVADAKVATPTEDPVAMVWMPIAYTPVPKYTVLARVDDASAAIPTIETAIGGIGGDFSAANIRPIAAQIEAALFGPRTAALLLGTFGLLALGLAAIGIYGVMTYTVKQRTREIGIRMALGARPRDVRRFVLLQAMSLVVAGIGIGIAGGLLLQDVLAGMLFEVPTADPVAYGGATVAMALLALGAGWLPAHHATAIQPNAAMRDV